MVIDIATPACRNLILLRMPLLKYSGVQARSKRPRNDRIWKEFYSQHWNLDRGFKIFILLGFEKGQGFTCSVDEGLAGGDQSTLFVKYFDVITGSLIS